MTTASRESSRGGFDLLLVASALILAALLIWAAAIALQAFFHSELEDERRAKIVEVPSVELELWRTEQERLLAAESAAPDAQGRVRIPIEDAMAEVARQHGEERR